MAQARLARRGRLAERELRAIGDFVKEIGSRLSSRVQRDLDRRNEADRKRLKALLAAMGDERGSNRYPSTDPSSSFNFSFL